MHEKFEKKKLLDKKRNKHEVNALHKSKLNADIFVLDINCCLSFFLFVYLIEYV